jgi:hypothetical protein
MTVRVGTGRMDEDMMTSDDAIDPESRRCERSDNPFSADGG